MNTKGGNPVSSAGLYALRNNPDLADYFTGNGNRIAACRAMLDLLGIPYPSWAQREASGRAAQHKAMITAFRDDNPHQRYPSAR